MSQGGASLRFEPGKAANSANPAPVAAEFEALDRKVGWLIVNRWTYRIMRTLGRWSRPEAKSDTVRISTMPALGKGTILVEPNGQKKAGALLLIHGGGYVIGSPWDILPKAVHFARALGITVACPAYSLSPEAPFPAALDDCYAAWTDLLSHADRLGLDPARIAVGGYSAGAGLAACLVQRLRDEGSRLPAGQLLAYPMLDDATATRRELDTPRHRVWSNRNNLFGWASYLGHPPGQPSAPYTVAARCNDLTDLPPTWLGVGTCDLFLDEDRSYAQRLTEAGVDTTYVEADGAIHGFDMADTPTAKAFVASQADFLQRFSG